MRFGKRREDDTPPPAGPSFVLDQAAEVFLAAAPFVRAQQLFRVIRAFELVADELPDWRLVVVGSGPQEALLAREIRRAGLGARVTVAPDPVPAAVFVAAPRALLPEETWAAMAAGLPVLTTEVGQLEPDETALVVAPGSNVGLAAGMLRLARDPALRARIGANGRAAGAAAEPGVAKTAGLRDGSGPEAHPKPAVSSSVTPVDARREVLRAALAAAEGLDPVLLPGLGVEPHRLVLAQEARARFFDRLDGPEWLSLRDPATPFGEERRGRVAEAARVLGRRRTSWCALEPWPDAGVIGQRCGLEVEFWERAPEGRLVAPRPNDLVETLPAERAAIVLEGTEVPTIPLATGRRIGAVAFPADAVFTWVDGSDDAWNARREARLAEVTGIETTPQASGRARYVDRDELRFALRSLHLFAPWFRRIFLVTAGQRPAWLDPADERITVVDHSEILAADALPTFNSQAIETGLHRIPGLAEHFVYFNDDFLIGRPVAAETFFDGAGNPTVWYADAPVGPTSAPGAAPYVHAAWNNRRLLERDWGVTLTRHLAHAPYAHRRSLLARLEQRFPAEWAATEHATFRSDADLSVASSLAQHVALAEGTARVAPKSLAYLDLGSPALPARLQAALARRQDFLCLGDAHAFGLAPEELDADVGDFLAAYFPLAAPWERQDSASA